MTETTHEPSDASSRRAGPSTTTSRLLLDPFTVDDAPSLHAFMSDPSAMRHTYVAPSIEHCSERLGAYEAMRSVLGFAPWVVRLASSSQIIGWGGLCIDPDEPQWGLEVIYAFAPGAWGRGYASELVRTSLLVAFGLLNAREVHAFVRPENAASVGVLAKCGFRFLRHEPSLQRDHYRVESGALPPADPVRP